MRSSSATALSSLQSAGFVLPCLLVAATVSFGQQTAPNPDLAPVNKGRVLFERHESAAPDITSQTTAPEAADEAPDPHPRKGTEGKPGISSSQRRARTTLHRRDAAGTEPPAAQPLSAGAQGTQSGASSSLEDASDPQAAPVIPSEDREKARRITEADRAAVAVLQIDLDMHLNTHSGAVEARAQMQVLNGGSAPLLRLPLRISGALQWDSARIVMTGSDHVPPSALSRGFSSDQYRVPDDLDHTGTATEIALTLPEPLSPGKTLQLDLYYKGELAAGTQRLTALGAPAGRAALTDWDTVSDTFTGLRGLGNVLWYPATGPTSSLRNGDAVTRAVENSRTRDAQTAFHLHLTVEYTGSRPDAAFFMGERQVLRPTANGEAAGVPSPADEGFVAADWTRAALGPHTPSLFIVDAAPHLAADGLLRVVTERADTAAAFGEAATRIRPVLTEWLGAAPSAALDVIDLPIPGAAGFADGTLLVAPLTTGSAAWLAPSLVQPMTAAWLPANLHTEWLREGIPAFLQAIWIERTEGRAAALKWLAANASVAGTGTTGPASRNDTDSALPTCTDPSCARGKGAYVLEMLRGMMGDQRLQQVLSGWRFRVDEVEPAGVPLMEPVQDMQKRETAWFEMGVQQAGPKDMRWFCRDWIDADHGLPDLTIVTVAPRRIERGSPTGYLPRQRKPVAGPIGAEPLPPDPRDLPSGGTSSSSNSGATAPAAGSWLVAVEVQNNGGAEAEVPVTVLAGSLTNTLPLRVPAHGRATIRVPFEAEPQEVLVNDGSVPEARTSQHRRAITDLSPAR